MTLSHMSFGGSKVKLDETSTSIGKIPLNLRDPFSTSTFSLILLIAF